MQSEIACEFIEALAKSTENLLDFVSEHEPEALRGIISEFTEDQLSESWNKLSGICLSHVSDLSVETDNNEEVALNTRVVLMIVKLVEITVTREPLFIPQHLILTVQHLSIWLSSIPDNLDNVKNKISQVCEKWLVKDYEGKDPIAPAIVHYILKRTLHSKSAKANLNRLWNIRNCVVFALQEETESSKVALELLNKCFFTKLFVSNVQGRKLLSYFITNYDVVCLKKFHHTAKSFLMSCSAKDADAYGNVYYRAWLDSRGSMREAFEEWCIQDMILFAIHLPSSEEPTLFLSIRKVLHAFVQEKHRKEVASMLLALYDPILWRSLTVPNSTVRNNAAHLLFDTFPLAKPFVSLEESETVLESQCQAMETLLEDDYQCIRIIAARGLCSLLARRWEEYPCQRICKILKFLCEDLICDSSTVEVRVTVVKGLTDLLENPLSHSLLKSLLPKTSFAFHDVSEKVRLEYCDLLLKVKSMPDIQYWKIVPTDHLLARLDEEEERLDICHKIFTLTLPSFFPKSSLPLQRIQSCSELIKMNRSASREFFRQLAPSVDVPNALEYMTLLPQVLCKKGKEVNVTEERAGSRQRVNKKKDKRMRRGARGSDQSGQKPVGDKENVDAYVSSTLVDMYDPNIICGFLDSVCILWWGMISNRNKGIEKDQLKPIQKEFSTTAIELFKRFKKSDEVYQTLIYLCSTLGIDIPNLSSTSISLLKAFPNTASSKQYLNILASVGNQNLFPQILKLIHSWLSSGLKRDVSKNRGRSREMVVDLETPKPLLGVHFLQDLLKLQDSRRTLLANYHDTLSKQIFPLSALLLKCIREHCVSPNDASHNSENIFLKEAFSVFCQLAVLLDQKEPIEEEDVKFNSVTAMIKIIFWAENELLPIWLEMREPSDENSFDTSGNLSDRNACTEMLKSVFETLLTMMSDMFLVAVANKTLCCAADHFLSTIFQSGVKDIDPVLLCNVFHNMVIYVLTLKASGTDTSQLEEQIANVFSELLKLISRTVRADSENGARYVVGLKPPISSILKSMMKWLDLRDMILCDFLATMMATVIAELTRLIERESFLETRDEISGLPTISSAILGVVASDKRLTRVFVDQLSECLTSGVIKAMSGCLAVLQILHTLSIDMPCQIQDSDFHRACIAANRLFKELMRNLSCGLDDNSNIKVKEFADAILTNLKGKLDLE